MLLRAGWNGTQITEAVRSGAIERVGHGVYVAGPEPDPLRVAALRTRGVVSHLSAASLWGLDLVEPPSVTHVIKPRTSSICDDDAAVIHRLSLQEHEVTSHRGLMVTTPLRTVLDCARHSSERDALLVADSALRQRLIRRSDLANAARDCKGPRSMQARRTLALADPLSGSALETLYRLLMLRARLEPWVAQYQLRDSIGEPVVRLDFAWPEIRLAVEVDGYAVHGTLEAFRRDRRRGNAAVRRGWVVLRFSWDDVVRRPDEVVACIRETIAARHRDLRAHAQSA